MNQLFYIQVDTTEHISRITNQDMMLKPKWYLVAVNSSHLTDFQHNYTKYTYDPYSGVLHYPGYSVPTNLPNPGSNQTVVNSQDLAQLKKQVSTNFQRIKQNTLAERVYFNQAESDDMQYVNALAQEVKALKDKVNQLTK